MSSDPVRDLAQTLDGFVNAAFAAVTPEPFTRESPAATEAENDDMADDEWGSHPVRDAWIASRQRSDAGLDHLRAMAELLSVRNVVMSLSTVTRGALEAFAGAYYLGAPEITARERVRRSMNARLDSGHETGRLMESSALDPQWEDQTDRAAMVQAQRDHSNRMRSITEAARRHGFNVRNERDNRRVTCLDEPQPTITSLCRDVVGKDTRLGEVYYRNLSSVAHSKNHGLTQHLMVLAPLDDPTVGDATAAVTLTPRDAALRLMGAPLSAVAVVAEVFPACGWTVPETEIRNMLYAWGRVAQVPHPDDPGV